MASLSQIVSGQLGAVKLWIYEVEVRLLIPWVQDASCRAGAGEHGGVGAPPRARPRPGRGPAAGRLETVKIILTTGCELLCPVPPDA